MSKKEYLSPISEIFGLNSQEDLLAGGGGMFKTSGMDEQYMAPSRSVKSSRLYI